MRRAREDISLRGDPLLVRGPTSSAGRDPRWQQPRHAELDSASAPIWTVGGSRPRRVGAGPNGSDSLPAHLRRVNRQAGGLHRNDGWGWRDPSWPVGRSVASAGVISLLRPRDSISRAWGDPSWPVDRNVISIGGIGPPGQIDGHVRTADGRLPCKRRKGRYA